MHSLMKCEGKTRLNEVIIDSEWWLWLLAHGICHRQSLSTSTGDTKNYENRCELNFQWNVEPKISFHFETKGFPLSMHSRRRKGLVYLTITYNIMVYCIFLSSRQCANCNIIDFHWTLLFCYTSFDRNYSAFGIGVIIVCLPESKLLSFSVDISSFIFRCRCPSKPSFSCFLPFFIRNKTLCNVE